MNTKLYEVTEEDFGYSLAYFDKRNITYLPKFDGEKQVFLREVKVPVENRVDFLSVCETKAISAHGELFTVGDLVKHDDNEAGTATIQYFCKDLKTNDILAVTEKGFVRICFITKA